VEFYGMVAPIMSMIGDIHTTIETPDDALNYLATQTELFPFDVRIIGKQVFVASNNSADSAIPVGSRILKINGQPIEQVLTKMKAYFSDEGKNETLKLRRVEKRFTFQYYLTYGDSSLFTLEYSVANKPSVIGLIHAEPFSIIRQRRAKNQINYPKLKSLFAEPPYLGLAIITGQDVARLTVKWFQNDVLQTSNESFKSFNDSAFSEIQSRKINNLIIDIRNNGGGESENASYLFSYLADKPFRFLYAMDTNEKNYLKDVQRGVRYKPSERRDRFQTSDSTTKLDQFFGLNFQQPQRNNFKGNVYVLIDGLTTSAAAQFASLIKLNGRGVLVGEDAPGALHGGSGRGYSYFLLPHSQLLTMISKYRLHLSKPGKTVTDVIVTADHRPTVTITDILNGVDKVMEFTSELIRQSK
jgi:C-terminal processing protease CtpA/Prc